MVVEPLDETVDDVEVIREPRQRASRVVCGAEIRPLLLRVADDDSARAVIAELGGAQCVRSQTIAVCREQE